MLAWNPADHPRDAAGRFVAKGGGIAGLVAVVVLFLLAGGFLKSTGNGSAAAAPPSTWKSAGLEFRTLNSDTSATCEAYGSVKAFLAAHPCSGVRRGLFEVGEPGKEIGVGTATVTMPSPELAQQLKALIDRPGTGNITELTTGFDGNHYASRVTGNVVTVAQAKRQLLADPSSAALDRAAQAALEAPSN